MARMLGQSIGQHLFSYIKSASFCTQLQTMIVVLDGHLHSFKMAREYETFDEFFPYYLREHANPRTRYFHYIGTGLVILILLGALVNQNGALLIAVPVAGYAFAWAGHAFVEKNKPATFTYPLWSLISDFKMFFLALSGKLGDHLERAGIHKS